MCLFSFDLPRMQSTVEQCHCEWCDKLCAMGCCLKKKFEKKLLLFLKLKNLKKNLSFFLKNDQMQRR
jgi:hypothetical protein